MIFQLVIKFYLRHAKRTIRGSKIIAISLLALIVTELLILAFTTQITTLSLILENDGNSMVIEPEGRETFKLQEYNELSDYLTNNRRISNFHSEYREFGQILHENSTLDITLHFTNLDQIEGLNKIQNDFLLTNEFSNQFNVGDEFIVNINNHHQEVTLNGFIDSTIKNIHMGAYFEISNYNITEFSHLYLVTRSSADLQIVKEEILDQWEVETLIGTSENDFINDSRVKISNILSILAIMISILIVFGVSNLIRTIILESEHEIRVLKSIGYHPNSIRLIYIGLSSLIGIIGSFLSLVFGISIPSTIFALLVVSINYIYIPIQFSFEILFNVLALGIVTSLGASLIPTWRYIK